MPNASAVPLGDGVSIASGFKTNLGYLLDCNQATYRIASGSSWHLLYILAQRGGVEPTDGWAFSLQSTPLTEVRDMIKTDGTDTASLVDSAGTQVRPYANEFPTRTFPSIASENQTAISHYFTASQVNSKFEGDEFTTWKYIDLSLYQGRKQVTLVQETGAHIYPIAYHRIKGGSPPQAEIVQCARSDFHFWPLPTIPVWSSRDQITGINLTTHSPEEP